GRCDHCKARALTCSPLKQARQRPLLGSCECSNVPARPQGYRSQFTPTCSGMLADTNSLTMATIRDPWRTISGIETFNLLQDTLRSRLIGLRSSGRTKAGRTYAP